MKFVSKAAVLSAAAGVAVVGGAGVASAYGAGAAGVAQNSPGVLSGNLIQVPVDVPVNVCGNTVNIVALLNPAFGNTCANV
ncbi:chaplin [Streptomyces tubercidicus]|uniref:chaplin n=1 Tax=Streptomyces tubercidicus TaxID=47759 RepID=UPI00346687C2